MPIKYPAPKYCIRGRHKRLIIQDEIAAKLALATRLRKDKGEHSYYQCGKHYHLSRKATNVS